MPRIRIGNEVKVNDFKATTLINVVDKMLKISDIIVIDFERYEGILPSDIELFLDTVINKHGYEGFKKVGFIGLNHWTREIVEVVSLSVVDKYVMKIENEKNQLTIDMIENLFTLKEVSNKLWEKVRN